MVVEDPDAEAAAAEAEADDDVEEGKVAGPVTAWYAPGVANEIGAGTAPWGLTFPFAAPASCAAAADACASADGA